MTDGLLIGRLLRLARRDARQRRHRRRLRLRRRSAHRARVGGRAVRTSPRRGTGRVRRGGPSGRGPGRRTGRHPPDAVHVLTAGTALDDDLCHRIREAVRTGASPRHVPDEIIEVPTILHTRTGKKLKVPVKRLLQGAPVEQVVNPAAVDTPALIDHYARLGAERRAQRLG